MNRRGERLDPSLWDTPERPITKVGVFYFVQPAARGDEGNRFVKRGAAHGEPAGCSSARSMVGNIRRKKGSAPQVILFTEDTVWEDASGRLWRAAPTVRTGTHDGWVPTSLCAKCGHLNYDEVLADRPEGGACFGSQHEGFFNNSAHTRVVKEARAMCMGDGVVSECPIRVECGEWGERLHRIVPGGIPGMYGGETETERKDRLADQPS